MEDASFPEKQLRTFFKVDVFYGIQGGKRMLHGSVWKHAGTIEVIDGSIILLR